MLFTIETATQTQRRLAGGHSSVQHCGISIYLQQQQTPYTNIDDVVNKKAKCSFYYLKLIARCSVKSINSLKNILYDAKRLDYIPTCRLHV